MVEQEPLVELEQTFSSPDAAQTPWAQARKDLQAAPVYWLSTVRPGGRPHVTPLGDAIRGGGVLVYRVAPSKALGFGKGTTFSQTRWRFS